MPSASTTTPSHAAPDASDSLCPPSKAAHHEATTSSKVHTIILPMGPSAKARATRPHRVSLTSCPAESRCTSVPACFSACICLYSDSAAWICSRVASVRTDM